MSREQLIGYEVQMRYVDEDRKPRGKWHHPYYPGSLSTKPPQVQYIGGTKYTGGEEPSFFPTHELRYRPVYIKDKRWLTPPTPHKDWNKDE